MDTFRNTTDIVRNTNPRTVLGYFEPGHYCFLVIDGRTVHSRGFRLWSLAEYMSNLGCVQAYNLDGGGSSSLWYNGKIISKPYDGGRKIADAVFLAEIEVEQ